MKPCNMTVIGNWNCIRQTSENRRSGDKNAFFLFFLTEGWIKIQICNKLPELRGSQPKLATLRALMLQMTGANKRDKHTMMMIIPIRIRIQIPIQIGPNANDDVCAAPVATWWCGYPCAVIRISMFLATCFFLLVLAKWQTEHEGSFT